jgi:methyl-accepting chemotaxis protein
MPLIALIIAAITIAGFFIASYIDTSIEENAELISGTNISTIMQELTSTDILLQERVHASMKVLQHLGNQLGAPSLGGQVNVGSLTTPDLLFGGQTVAKNYLLVDKVKSLVDGTATLFVKDGNNFIRVSTNVMKADGTRAIGTQLDPKGKAIASITQGNSFYGVVDILGKPYYTGYEPLKDINGNTIGVWYVGYPISTLTALGESIQEMRILENGFISLLDNKNEVVFNSSHIQPEIIKQFLESNSDESGWVFKKVDFSKWGYSIMAGYPESDVDSKVNSATWLVVLLGLILTAFLSGVCYFIFSKVILKPIKRLKEYSGKLAIGDVSFLIESTSKDELGDLENAFANVVQSINEHAQSAQKIAEGDLDITISQKSDKDILGISMHRVFNSLLNLINELKRLTNAAVIGELSSRGNIEPFKGVYKDIVVGVNNTIDALQDPVNEGKEVLKLMAVNNFTARVTGDFRGDHQILKNSINSVCDSLSNVLTEVNEAVQATASASTQITSSTEEMAAGSQEQSSQTAEVATAVEEMTRTILETSKNTETVSIAAKEAKETSDKGKAKVDNTKASIKQIVESSVKVGGIVTSLAMKSEQIGEITQVIDDIADQTNLLALNAAIEAARAGEQGRGFAVVADEVRKLAERTTKATKEIAETIKAVQKEAATAEEAMKESKVIVEKGMKNTEEVETVLMEINNNSSRVADLVSQISAASEEQSTTAEQISKNIEAINSVTHESASGIQEVARASEDLNRLTDNLQNLVSRFKIKASEDTVYSVRKNGKLIKN